GVTRRRCVEHRLRDLLQSRGGYVISGLRSQLKAEKLTGQRRKTVGRRWSIWGAARSTCRTTCPRRQATRSAAEWLRGLPPLGQGPDGADRHEVRGGRSAGDALCAGLVSERPAGEVPGAPLRQEQARLYREHAALRSVYRLGLI